MPLCQCFKCSHHSSAVNQTGQQINGWYISAFNQQKHQVADRENQNSNSNRLTNNKTIVKAPQFGSGSNSQTESNSSLENYPSKDKKKPTVVEMVTTFMCWLHFDRGVSLNKCWTARDLVLKMMVEAQENPSTKLSNLAIPKDTRTILKNSLNVKLEEYTCFPTCYVTLYHPPHPPSKCTYRKTPKAKRCGTLLFREKKLFVGGSHQGQFRPQKLRLRPGQFSAIETPRCTFVLQKLETWIPWFLSLPNVESAIEDWGDKVLHSPPDVDIQQGSAWKKLV
ncbi:hypothetical protein PCANC_28798 [Puccinia coronata f. sp. avenae]|uniref:Uncharacterized protein n=1 Tax=Puccinia coronata f. sp. avenae TaxID=200324 RepID=A0A2N5TH91_9BASI|nr:hypothetical protein PCANC_28798 [Puccinia coronata f. sp. avenae]